MRNDFRSYRAGIAVVLLSAGSTAWSVLAQCPQQKLRPADSNTGDQVGRAIAADGEVAVFGAAFDRDFGSRAGSATVWVRENGRWIENVRLNAPDPRQGDEFGRAVAVSGDTVLIAAPFDDDAGVDSGSVFAFRRGPQGWEIDGQLTAPDALMDGRFGMSVAMEGPVAVIGAPGARHHRVNRAGAAYVYRRDDDGWTFVDKLTLADPESDDDFGAAVAIHGEWIAVALPDETVR